MRSADGSPLGALRLSCGQLCAQRMAHRWAHCASLAASYALSGWLTAGRIAPLLRPAMRSADCSPLGALRLSCGQLCAQRLAHRWAHCASLAASYALSGLLTAGRIAPLLRPAMRSADCSPLGALRLSCGQLCAQRIACSPSNAVFSPILHPHPLTLKLSSPRMPFIVITPVLPLILFHVLAPHSPIPSLSATPPPPSETERGAPGGAVQVHSEPRAAEQPRPQLERGVALLQLVSGCFQASILKRLVRPTAIPLWAIRPTHQPPPSSGLTAHQPHPGALTHFTSTSLPWRDSHDQLCALRGMRDRWASILLSHPRS
ncbi:unnamed protein product [Closterium sp. Naga37s-1]|nr:unnamed protein product [Closterium sp. Naga37s-1]